MIWTRFVPADRIDPENLGARRWRQILALFAVYALNFSAFSFCVVVQPKEIKMAKGQQKGNRETKKPKKEKAKVIAAAPSQKTEGWQPSFASGKKK
jgi:hypothetical protein